MNNCWILSSFLAVYLICMEDHILIMCERFSFIFILKFNGQSTFCVNQNILLWDLPFYFELYKVTIDITTTKSTRFTKSNQIYQGLKLHRFKLRVCTNNQGLKLNSFKLKTGTNNQGLKNCIHSNNIGHFHWYIPTQLTSSYIKIKTRD